MIVYIVAVIVILLSTMIEILQLDEDTLTAKLYIELQMLSIPHHRQLAFWSACCCPTTNNIHRHSFLKFISLISQT